MNFIKFPVISTNIFPLANTVETGGQLVTEYNLKSKDSVLSDPTIQYDSWISYTHGPYDFEISAFADEAGAITPYILNISRGKAVVNGHFIESLIDVQIDLVEANAERISNAQSELTGRLAVGLRAYYATESTMAGALKAENDDMYYGGIQVVVLPKSELKLPIDSPTDETQVNCHLLLGDFLYENGTITDVIQNESKIAFLDSKRLSSTSSIIGGEYIKSTGMDPQKFYVFSGQGNNESKPSESKSTWCDATDNLINWTDAITVTTIPDAHVGTTAKFDTIVSPRITYTYTVNDGGDNYNIDDIVATNVDGVFVRVTALVGEAPGPIAVNGVTATDAGSATSHSGTAATITATQVSANNYNTKVALYLPHKQVDDLVDSSGTRLYYPTKTLPLPLADFATNSAGTVDATYTKNIKAISAKIADVYHLTGGRQLAYIEHLAVGDSLPTINVQAWQVGDYILVGQDDNVAVSTDSRAPSTIYSIVPGYVKSYQYVGRGAVDGYQPSRDSNGYIIFDNSGSDPMPVYESTIDYEDDIPRMYKVINGGSGYSVGDIVETNVPGIFVEVVSVSSGAVSTVTSAIARSASAHGTGAVINADLIKGISLEEVAINYSGQTLKQADSEWHIIPDVISEPYNVIPDNSLDPYKYSSDDANGPIQGTSDFRGAAVYKVGDTTEGPDYFIRTVNYNVTVTSSNRYTYSINRGGSGYNVGDIVLVSNYSQGNTGLCVTVTRTYDEDSTTGIIAEVADTSATTPSSAHGTNAKITASPVQYTKAHSFREYYKVVSNTKKFTWSDAVIVSNEFGLAQTTTVGGFLNVDDTVTDGGYITRDDNGHLKLIDYALLRSGTLAYQLGEDVNFPSNMGLDELQEYLDEYVNDRVAFPNAAQLQTDTPNVININIPLLEYNEEATTAGERTPIIIRDIDSRFNTSVHFNFTGSGVTTNTLIYILDCAKVRVTVDTSDNCYPEIQIFRSNLYYDASLLNYVKTYRYSPLTPGLEDIKLWYEQFEATDPALTVNEMTVSDLSASIQPSEFTKWNAELAPNDNHYYVALRSITFSGNGDIIGCEVIMADGSDKIYSGTHVIVNDFTLPQGSGLQYPEKCLTYELKIVGSFTSGYYDSTTRIWMISTVNVSASIDTYESVSNNEGTGTIAFIAETKAVDVGLDTKYKEGGVQPWTFGSYNIFKGGYIVG